MQAGDDNLAVTWGRLGVTAGFATESPAAMTLTSSGLPVAFVNGAFVRPGVADGDSVVSEAQAFFARRGVPWLLWVRQGADRHLSDACRRSGANDTGGPVAMVLADIASRSPQPPPAGLTVTIASEPPDVDAVRPLMTSGFDMPTDVTERVITVELFRSPDVCVLIGRVAGVPVSCSMVSVTGDVAGVYNVATPPEFRRRGFGEALSWAALMEGRLRGATAAVLQASPDGQGIYARMGFEEHERYEQWEFPASAPM